MSREEKRDLTYSRVSVVYSLYFYANMILPRRYFVGGFRFRSRAACCYSSRHRRGEDGAERSRSLPRRRDSVCNLRRLSRLQSDADGFVLLKGGFIDVIV